MSGKLSFERLWLNELTIMSTEHFYSLRMREGGEWTKFQHESDVECLAIDVDRRSASSSQTMLVTSHRAGYSINYKQLSRFIDT